MCPSLLSYSHFLPAFLWSFTVTDILRLSSGWSWISLEPATLCRLAFSPCLPVPIPSLGPLTLYHLNFISLEWTCWEATLVYRCHSSLIFHSVIFRECLCFGFPTNSQPDHQLLADFYFTNAFSFWASFSGNSQCTTPLATLFKASQPFSIIVPSVCPALKMSSWVFFAYLNLYLHISSIGQQAGTCPALLPSSIVLAMDFWLLLPAMLFICILLLKSLSFSYLAAWIWIIFLAALYTPCNVTRVYHMAIIPVQHFSYP